MPEHAKHTGEVFHIHNVRGSATESKPIGVMGWGITKVSFTSPRVLNAFLQHVAFVPLALPQLR